MKIIGLNSLWALQLLFIIRLRNSKGLFSASNFCLKPKNYEILSYPIIPWTLWNLHLSARQYLGLPLLMSDRSSSMETQVTPISYMLIYPPQAFLWVDWDKFRIRGQQHIFLLIIRISQIWSFQSTSSSIR